MEKFIVSMLRFSTAISLFGLEQMQNAMRPVTGGEDVNQTMERFGKSLDSVTDSIIGEMDQSKRKTVDSATRASEDTVHQTFRGLNLGMLDPREMMRATSDIIQKTTDSMADMVPRDERSAEQRRESEPRSAADVLSRQEPKQSEAKKVGKPDVKLGDRPSDKPGGDVKK